MTVTVRAPGAPQLVRDLNQAADQLEALEASTTQVAALIAGRAAQTAPRLSGALAAGTTAQGPTVVVAGVAADYVTFVRFGTSRMAARDYITQATRPHEVAAIVQEHLDAATEPLEKNYG